MTQKKEINLKNINVQIFVSVFLALITISAYFIISSYTEAIGNEERNVLKRLEAITETTALQISGNEQEAMFNSNPDKNGILSLNEDSIYYKIHNILKNVAEVNSLQSPIYIAVYNFETEEFLMSVSSDDKVFFRHEYNSYPQQVIDQYKEGGEIPMYIDEFGSWLSSFTPLKNDKGEVVAIIQTDVPFDDFLSSTQGQLIKNIMFSIGVLLIVGLIMFFSLRRVLKKDKAAKRELVWSKKIIQEKQEELVDSITYALRIQRAILPTDSLIQSSLPENFVLYKPKDIVAGDFYWLESKSDLTLFAAADCTGHGVPGAMVSVVCHNALNRAAREFNLADPGQILDKARELVIDTFNESDQEVKDGMDIALCALHCAGAEWVLEYAGANNPLWIIRDGEIIETKADKQPIGEYTNPKPFTTHSIELHKGDSIYTFSDGYVDQFGGEKGKKFKPSNFRKLLLSIQDQPLSKQKELLNEAFENWRGDLEQIDDVCIIGVRI
jgi:serine phosphatase RsbU (regulator of sigma subunit)